MIAMVPFFPPFSLWIVFFINPGLGVAFVQFPSTINNKPETEFSFHVKDRITMECETAASNEFPGCLENDLVRLGRYKCLRSQMNDYLWLAVAP